MEWPSSLSVFLSLVLAGFSPYPYGTVAVLCVLEVCGDGINLNKQLIRVEWRDLRHVVSACISNSQLKSQFPADSFSDEPLRLGLPEILPDGFN